MTQRERQILNWIEADPMISQQELADRAGITRSSVAVHISNLMKKGCIAGKGYIVTRSPYVTVVGGMNMDIGGRPYKTLVGKDSNPGAVRMSPGGVGRNIAHNMSLMGLDVRLVTAFGDDVYAQKLAAVCGELGIDISQSPVIPGGHTSTYLFINDEAGDMQLAVADMDIYENLTPGELASRRQLLDGSQVVVLDTNLTPELIEEGFVREVISKIQTMRKEAGYEVTDRITVTCATDEKLAAIIARGEKEICRAVLAEKLEMGTPASDAYVKEWNINGENAVLATRKV